MSESIPAKPTTPGRVMSLDAYRGFVMLAMASAGLGLGTVASHFPESALLGAIGNQVEHVEWRGGVFWDLIQPSFMFLVGASLPFSTASRIARGDSAAKRFRHAAVRSLILIALGVFLASNGEKQTQWVFTNVLAQIGLGYVFVYLLSGLSIRGILIAAGVILAADWVAFALYSPPPALNPYAMGWTTAWRPMFGFYMHWEKNVNVAAAFDRWFLNLFPRPDGVPFVYNVGGYTTLNFIPSMATMLFGAAAGKVMISPVPSKRKAAILMLAGAAAVTLGSLLDVTICPSVKRIWTPSWAVQSSGFATVMLAIAVRLFDDLRLGRLAYPFLVVGSNSIVMYMMAQLIKPWVRSTIRAHLNTLFFAIDGLAGREILPRVLPTGFMFPGRFGAFYDSAAVLFVLWLVCYQLHRARIFVKI